MTPMTYFQQYSVRVSPGREIQDGYVWMKHGDVYTLTLRNDRDVRCDANVQIDGRDVGTWRIGSRQSITLERPINDEGRFTFYQSGTPEFSKVGGDSVKVDDRGLVRVVFTPEFQSPKAVFSPVNYVGVDSGWKADSSATYSGAMYSNDIAMASAPSGRTSTRGMSSGVTGLSGHSNQKFYTVEPLNYDFSKQITINLRLIVGNDDPRSLVSLSTPVPPPVP